MYVLYLHASSCQNSETVVDVLNGASPLSRIPRLNHESILTRLDQFTLESNIGNLLRSIYKKRELEPPAELFHDPNRC